jgi:hypothetical protein
MKVISNSQVEVDGTVWLVSVTVLDRATCT